MMTVVYKHIKYLMENGLKSGVLGLFLLGTFAIILPFTAHAQELDDITNNIVDSSQKLPALVSAIAYLLGILLGATGILKLKEHVENPAQAPLRTAIIRFIIGGALFALPIIYETMWESITDGQTVDFDPSGNLGNSLSALLGDLFQIIPSGDLNNVLSNIIDSIEDTPRLISAAAYLLGLISGVAGLLKLKDHVENPDQTPVREGVIRLLVGGALFGLPTVYQAMSDTIGDASFIGQITSLINGLGLVYSSYGLDDCTPVDAFGGSLGNAVCGAVWRSAVFPAFLSAIAYLIGLILGFMGILKIRDHVLNPQQVQIWDGASRLLAGGVFFTLPVIVEVARATVAPGVLIPTSFVAVSGYNGIDCNPGLGLFEFFGGGEGPEGGGLDVKLACLTGDLIGPIHIMVNFFSIVAGMILLMIATSRLVAGGQEGGKGGNPLNLGTVMTFVAAGALISYNELVRAATSTMGFAFGDLLPVTATRATLSYTEGMTQEEILHAETVVSAILKFMIMIGLISFVRGILIVRQVAEGSQQASMMAGLTHIIGGAIAVNLGPLMNAVQVTLGIEEYGIAFSVL